MTLKLELDALDGVDEAVRGLYKEKEGGGFVLDVDGLPDVSGLKKKVAELIGETKAERDKRLALEKSQEDAEADRKRKAGEFQALYEKSQADLEKERQAAGTYKQQIREKEINVASRTLAAELTRDTARAAVLADIVSKHIKVADDGAETSFEIGGVTIERAKLLEHMKAQYPFLVDGNQANGGGAPGGNGGAAPVKSAGDFGGSKEERQKAIAAKFPDLAK